jgi:hypothetical protein
VFGLQFFLSFRSLHGKHCHWQCRGACRVCMSVLESLL